MKLPQYFGRVDLQRIRRLMKAQIERQYYGRIDQLPRNPFFRYIYFRAQITTVQVLADSTHHYYPEAPLTDGFPAVYHDAIADLEHFNLPAAVTAWLTVDDWRWHQESEYRDAARDLHYGLVLAHPEPVAIAAAYAANINRPTVEKFIGKPTMKLIEARALEMAREVDPDFDIGREIAYDEWGFSL